MENSLRVLSMLALRMECSYGIAPWRDPRVEPDGEPRDLFHQFFTLDLQRMAVGESIAAIKSSSGLKSTHCCAMSMIGIVNLKEDSEISSPLSLPCLWLTAGGRSIAAIQSISHTEMHPPLCAVNHRQGGTDRKEFPIRLCPPIRHISCDFELSGGQSRFGLNSSYGSAHCHLLSITGKVNLMRD